jgi:hypothetical protein
MGVNGKPSIPRQEDGFMLFVKKKQLSQILSVVTMAYAVGISDAQADQPAGIGWSIAEGATAGTALAGLTPGGDSQVTLKLTPWSREDANTNLLVVFQGCGEDPQIAGKPLSNLDEIIAQKSTSPLYNRDWVRPGPRWRVCPDKNAVLIPAGQSGGVMLQVDFLRLAGEGMIPRLKASVYPVDPKLLEQVRTPEELALRYSKLPAAAETSLELYYRLKNKEWTLSDYAGVFGLPSRNGVGGTGNYDANASVLPVNVEDYRRSMPIPGLLRDDGGELLKRTLADVIAKGSGLTGDQICYSDFGQNTASITDDSVQTQAASHTISGKFSTKWTADHSLHPGWGFRVDLYQSTSAGAVVKWLGAGWVQSNGTWSIPVNSTLGFTTGSYIRVYYRSYNAYYAPQDQNNAKYSWVDPTWQVNSTNHYVGHRYADTDGGKYNGVGELVDAAMTMWSRLYWSGGINPVPGSPIKFYFPNTWENCGGSSPWSCASTAGDIWLIAEHGAQADVVTHEMGHQLNNKFWGGKRPAGSGGSHTLTGCYPTRLGMTLREGFANFVAAWVGYPSRNEADGGFGSGRWALAFDPESRLSPPNCTSGKANETWVARAFWDLHDTHADGDDVLWFNHPGAVMALYLSNGIANDGDARDMTYYEAIYKNAATDGHEGYIGDIFDQNRM